MLFVTYWELNENMSVGERVQVGQKLTTLELFPPKDVNVIRWDGTADGWGILITEAESVAAIIQAIEMWRAAGVGFFKCTKTSPAMPIQEFMPLQAELLEALGG